MNDYKEVLARNLIGLRDKAWIKQKELAAHLSIDRTTYSKYEAGVSEPDIAKLVAIADYYGVTVDHLLGRPGPQREAAAQAAQGAAQAGRGKEAKDGSGA